MRTYQIYLIEDEFAHHFFGRERLFFNLFLEYIQTTGTLRGILQKQIEYVTKTIPKQQVEKVIKQQMKKKNNFLFQNGEYYIENSNGINRATLLINDHVLVVKAEGNYVAETVFFECIRKCGTSFLAIDFDHERFGWLKPIKERNFV